MRKQKGFSLIELLIVVAIILIVAAIAIPNLLRARMSANDAGAVQDIRVLNTAQVSYATSYPLAGYATTFVNLGPSIAPPVCDVNSACLIDNTFTIAVPPVKSGYQFFIVGAPPVAGIVGNYAVSADALAMNGTGTNNYCSTVDAVVRSMKTSTPPTTAPPQITTAASIAGCQTIAVYGPIQ